MEKKYKKYTVDELLQDDYFISSILHPTQESREFWDFLIQSGNLSAQDFEEGSGLYILLFFESGNHINHIISLPVAFIKEIERYTQQNKYTCHGREAGGIKRPYFFLQRTFIFYFYFTPQCFFFFTKQPAGR